MSVRKRKWRTVDGTEKAAWVCDYRDLKGIRRLKTFCLKKQADRFSTTVQTDLLDAYLKTKRPGQDCSPAEPTFTANPSEEKHMNTDTDNTVAGSAAIPLITDDNIDSMYDVLETINLAHGLLFNGDASENTQRSTSWLLGRAADRVNDGIALMETLQRRVQS